MNDKVERFTNEQMCMICSWFSNTINMANKLATGNVSHQGKAIRNHALNCLDYIADYFIKDDWHKYDRCDKTTAPKHGEIVLTHIEGGGFLAQSYNEHYSRFEENNCVDRYKHIELKID